MIHNPATPRMRRKAATSTPTFFRNPDHCPEEGVGGSSWRVTYRGQEIGDVYTTWSAAEGVHFRIRTPCGRTVTQEGSAVPQAYETRGAAVTRLLDLFGIDVEEPLDYDIHKGPRGGGEELLDRRY